MKQCLLGGMRKGIAAGLPAVEWQPGEPLTPMKLAQGEEGALMSIRSECWLAAAVVLLAVLGGCGPKNRPITLQMYQKLTLGMSYNQVVRIVGRHGVPGSGPPAGIADAASFEWSNADGSLMQCVFRDDKLVYKNQRGLQ